MIAVTEKRPVYRARKIIGSAIVTAGPLNVRKAATKDADVVGTIQKGQRFNVTEGSTNEFTAIIYRDEVCFAMTKYLEVTTNR